MTSVTAVLAAALVLPLVGGCEQAATDGTIQSASEISARYTPWSERPDQLWPEGVSERYAVFVPSDDGQLTLFGVDGNTHDIVFAYVGAHSDGPDMKCQLGDETTDAGEGLAEAGFGIPMTLPKGPKGPGGIPDAVAAAVLGTVEQLQAVAQESAALFEGLEL